MIKIALTRSNLFWPKRPVFNWLKTGWVAAFLNKFAAFSVSLICWLIWSVVFFQSCKYFFKIAVVLFPVIEVIILRCKFFNNSLSLNLLTLSLHLLTYFLKTLVSMLLTGPLKSLRKISLRKSILFISWTFCLHFLKIGLVWRFLTAIAWAIYLLYFIKASTTLTPQGIFKFNISTILLNLLHGFLSRAFLSCLTPKVIILFL